MHFNAITAVIALSSVVSAGSLRQRQSANPCLDAYNACVAAGTPEVACGCTATACLGEDNARNRAFCATATANLVLPTSTASTKTVTVSPVYGTSTPSPVASSDCSTSTKVIVATYSSIPGIPGGCNPAHPGSCPTPSAATVSNTPAGSASTYAASVSSGIPGGCNPAHPGSCPTPSAATVSQGASSSAAGSASKSASASASKTTTPVQYTGAAAQLAAPVFAGILGVAAAFL